MYLLDILYCVCFLVFVAAYNETVHKSCGKLLNITKVGGDENGDICVRLVLQMNVSVRVCTIVCVFLRA